MIHNQYKPLLNNLYEQELKNIFTQPTTLCLNIKTQQIECFFSKTWLKNNAPLKIHIPLVIGTRNKTYKPTLDFY